MRTFVGALLLVAVAPAQAAPKIETIASGLDHPWSLAFLPDGGVLVTERSGKLSLIAAGKAPAPISGVPAVYAKSQGGLFDVLLDPEFAANRMLYLSYAAGVPGANFTRIARARLDGTALRDVKVIFQVAPAKDTPVHFGGRMAMLADGTLVMTTGDGFDRREQAQRLQSGLGKIVRIRRDGGIPADNPFAKTPGAQASIWSYGHRNPQGLAYDAASGRLYAHEHGPKGGDEVNIIVRGGNYGWPIATKGLDYSGATISPFKTYKGMIDGVVVWVPSIAPSGLAVVRGAMWPAWQGDLIVGALASQELRRIDLDAGGAVVSQERIFPSIKARVRDVRTAPDGAIWVTTDEASGKVLRISQ
ncbi:PQQ-dependent sugar dehydrogenase [Sandarakinorhabdus sp.]|uniref:PQQ-dependent sugar dehydrogenase n=1 Tax=Sandarakinorhabdus sp. TaxID=1916663 RepID=UPI00286D87E9|nr:PQQ-dependent sugar dehydrogenase [Sandarakinorhabdus sp.]